MPHKENSRIVITGDVLMFLLVFIVVFGIAIIFSITRHGLCVRKNIEEQVFVPKTNLEQVLGHNPSYDLLICKR